VTDAPAALGVAYLDSSALVKLVVVEPESAALREAIKPWSGALATSAIAHVEVPRAVFAAGASGNRVVLILASVATVPRDSVIAAARSLQPPASRSLDAIHIASATSLGADLGVLITYDTRLQHAAAALGIAVLAPV
jgi:predicted nucleic acid-binding protein